MCAGHALHHCGEVGPPGGLGQGTLDSAAQGEFNSRRPANIEEKIRVVPALPPASNLMPQTISRFRSYCMVLACIHGLVLVMLPIIFVDTWNDATIQSPEGFRIFLLIIFVFVLAKLIAFVLLLRSDRRPWMWKCGLILLALGCANLLTLPFAVMIIKDWHSFPVKAYYFIAFSPPPLPHSSGPPPLPGMSKPPPLPSTSWQS